jgi:hypothetical protein
MQARTGLGFLCAFWALCVPLARADSFRPEATPLGVSFAELRGALRSEDANALAAVGAEALDRYDLDVTIEPERRRFSVRERILYTNAHASADETVWLRVFANEGVSEPPVRVGEVTCRPFDCSTLSDRSSLEVLRLARPLAPGETLTIDVKLSGSLTSIDESQTGTLGQLRASFAALSGGASSDYGLLSYGEGIASLAQFYAEIARYRGGQWIGAESTTIGDKGTDRLRHVRARVTVPAGTRVVASGEEVLLEPTRYEVRAPAVRDFTLLASASFVCELKRLGPVDVRAFALQRDRNALAQVVDVAKAALATYVARYGPYPYRELDLVEAPVVGGAGGVEFSGLATIASGMFRPADELGQLTALLGGAISAPRESVRELVIAHEVAHQYWHGLVGSDSRQAPVLDEALAQYSALAYFEHRYGVKRADLEADRQVAVNYRGMRMVGVADGAADRPTSAFESPIAYAGLVYGKAPLAYRAIARKLGEPALAAALRAYAHQHRFMVATRADLVSAFAARDRPFVERVLHRYFDELKGDSDLGSTLPGAKDGAGGDLPRLLGNLQGLLGGGGAGASASELAGAMRMLENALKGAK